MHRRPSNLGLVQHGLWFGTATSTWQKFYFLLQEGAARCSTGVSQAHQDFIDRATEGVLPSPINLHLWLGEDPASPLCAAPANLKHISVGFKEDTLGDTIKHFNWASWVSAISQQRKPPSHKSLRPGRGETSHSTNSSSLVVVWDWEMNVVQSQRLVYLCLVLVLWSRFLPPCLHHRAAGLLGRFPPWCKWKKCNEKGQSTLSLLPLWGLS